MNMVSVVSSVLLALSLAMFWGDGRALEGWALGYIAVLAYVNVIALGIEVWHEKSR